MRRLIVMAALVAGGCSRPAPVEITLAGFVVLRQLLDRWQAPTDRAQWWRERVTRCHQRLRGICSEQIRSDGRPDTPGDR